MKTFALTMTICTLASVSAAADLTLYSDDGFQGRPLNVVIDMPQLGSLNFNDRASSIVIEKGAWVLCTGEDFSGKCVTLEPGRYGSLKDLGLDDAITSVRHRDAQSPGIFTDAQATPAGH
jgi:Beta/Gamma crystallin